MNKETPFEKFFLNIHYVFAILAFLINTICSKIFDINLLSVEAFNKYSMDINIALLTTLLTMLGIFIALPNTEFRELMKQYNNDTVILNCIFFSIISSLLFIVFSVFNLFTKLLPILLIYEIGLTFILAILLYQFVKYINE